MDVTKLMAWIPTSVSLDVIDLDNVMIRIGPQKTLRGAIRVTVDRLINEEEKEVMSKNKHIVGLDCIAMYRYAPENKKSYFYIITER